MIGEDPTWGALLKGCSIRTVENHCEGKSSGAHGSPVSIQQHLASVTSDGASVKTGSNERVICKRDGRPQSQRDWGGASFFFRLIQLLHVPDSEAPAQILSDSRHPALVASQAQHRLAMDKTVATGTRLLKVYVPSTVTGCKSQRSRLWRHFS